MKYTLLGVAAMTFCCAGTAFAAEQTWTGTISDSKCGATHKAMIEHNKILTDQSCTEACVKGGAKYVLASGDKVYMLQNQKNPALAMYAGQAVTITGTLKGDTIRAAKITKK
jgi:hypothetical protein